MIQFSLHCEEGHQFDAWFRNNASYEDQKQQGILSCPICGNLSISKALMKPNLTKKSNQKGTETQMPASYVDADHNHQDAAVTATNLNSMTDQQKKFINMMREMRRTIEKNTEDVGQNFAREALKIHHEEAENRGIRGEVNAEEMQMLSDEGVECFPVPKLPEDQN